MIIIGYPGIGKSTLAGRYKEYIDWALCRFFRSLRSPRPPDCRGRSTRADSFAPHIRSLTDRKRFRNFRWLHKALRHDM